METRKMKHSLNDRVKWKNYTETTFLGTIKEVDASAAYQYFVKFDDGDEDWLEESDLELLEQPPKTGDVVEVKDDNYVDWSKRIFLFEHEGEYHCVANYTEEEFNHGSVYSIRRWPQMRPIPSEPKLSITVTLNDKEVPLSTISKDTLLELHKHSEGEG